MQGPLWWRHTMVTAAGSWAELRHDSLLYVKQPLVMMQGGHSDELPASQAGGYVEPRPDIYRALLELVQGLEGRVPAARAEPLQQLRGMLAFLVEVSELELAGRPFPKVVDQRLRQIGTELEALTRGHADRLPDQALIVDVHTLADGRGVRVLHAGVGRVDELWVVVPRGRQWVLTRGGVFSYYEFVGDVGQRLDDHDWGTMLQEGRAPPRPAWAMPVSRPRTRN